MEPMTLAALAYGGGQLASGLANIFGNDAAAKRERAAARARQQGYEEAGQIGTEYYQGMQQEYAPEAATYLSDLAQYRDALQQSPSTMGEFDSTIDVQSYMDPNVAYRQQQAQAALDASAAARGGMFSGSGAQAKALQDRSQQIAQQAFESAYSRGAQDRAFKYQDFLNRFRSAREAEQGRLAQLGTLSGLSGTARQNLFDARAGEANVGRETALGKAGALSDIQQVRANQLRQRGSDVGSMLSGAGQLGGGMLSQFGQPSGDVYIGDAVQLGLTGGR